MLMLVLQTVADYTATVAWGVGVLFALGLIVYVISSRKAGREGDEWEHEKQVTSAVETLTTSQQAVATSNGTDAQFLTDIEYLITANPTANRRQRVKQWFSRRFRRLYVHACRIEDADGRPIHVASVSGRRLAHRERDPLIRDVKTVVQALKDRDTPPATMSERYYDDITDGFVDIDETKSRVRGDCLTRIQSNMQRNGELERSELFDRLVYDSGFRYPPDIVREKLEQLTSRDLRQRKDGTLSYQRFQ